MRADAVILCDPNNDRKDPNKIFVKKFLIIDEQIFILYLYPVHTWTNQTN